MATPEQFYKAFRFLQDHPLFQYAGLSKSSAFPENLSVDVVKVDPTTRRIEDDRALNTRVEVWFEITVYEHTPDDFIYDQCKGTPTHYYMLDCGGPTFEDAVVELAKLVREQYNDDGSEKPETRALYFASSD